MKPIKSLGFSPCGMFFWGKARTRLHNWKKSQKTMIELKRIRRAACLWAVLLLTACVALATQAPTPKILATSSVSLELNAGKQVPALVRIKGPAGLLLVTRQEETLRSEEHTSELQSRQ